MSVRRAGVLLHPTSLPGPFGIGEIGSRAFPFLDWMEAAGQTLWQMLPLGPVDDSGSPYASPSACARNPLLIGLEDLVDDGLLSWSELPHPFGDRDRVHYPLARQQRMPALLLAASRVPQEELVSYASVHPWATTWSTFAAIAEQHGSNWTEWPEALRNRTDLSDFLGSKSYYQQMALQFLFDRQWARLRLEAKKRGISLIGDIPFFVSLEGADAWSAPELFRLDPQGRPIVVSGVPPDAFSADGQLWGHPLYDEDAHRNQRYAWWIERVRANLELVDAIRLDHFRGVAAYWEVEATAEHARNGHWIPGPGQPLLDALQAALGSLPFIAEDLGVITPDVEALRDQNALPGMAILQFGFGNPRRTTNSHLPHNHRSHQVVYPGTHDNPTVWGWYTEADEQTQDHVRRYLLVGGHDIAGDLTRAAYRSVADTAIVAMQDLLSLGPAARMNVPGETEGNWAWRFHADHLRPEIAARWADQARLTGRAPYPARAGI